MSKRILNEATAPVTGDRYGCGSAATFQVTVKGTGAVSATVVIEGSNDGEFFLELATVTISGTNSASDGFAATAPWDAVRARVTAVAGAGAEVSAFMGGAK